MPDFDPLWYKDAIIYEVHVRAFHDSIGDGMGDFPGLTQKLDYLQDLGVTAVWLLPFYPSPLKDDGYDIADYTLIHPHYGTLRDFKAFLQAAHDRGLRVITELVINHTSDQHPWFQRARRSPPGSVERDFYVWSDTPDKFAEARVIFQDFERSNWAYDPVARAYYWHRFYSHQPDLNYDNPAVWDAIKPVLDYWMEMGVDGMRLDAVPYLYEREGTNCENLPETHVFLQHLRAHVDAKFPGRMLLAEANQWPEDSAAYFGTGNECHMAFHFPVMPRLYMALYSEDRFPIVDIMAQTPPIPDNCQWGLFLRNHDELTLEMVTDEERDYMVRAYAQDARARINLGIRRRLAPLLGNDRRRIELMNGLLFSLPGTPVLYYGDEIGMGDNIYLGDRNGVRTPMQWSGDRNAGFSRANPQKLFLPVIIDPEYHYEAINVEAQQNNPSSLLWWTKRLIALRKQYKAFSRGSLEFLNPQNPKVLAFVRRFGDECVLVAANLSRFVQFVELDLRQFQGLTPVELFGRNVFPPISDRPYLLTLGAHAFYWFAMVPPRPGERGDPGQHGDVPLRVLDVGDGWDEVFRQPLRRRLERLLPAYLQRRYHPTGRTAAVKAARVQGAFPLPYGDEKAYLLLLRVDLDAGPPEVDLVPLAFVDDAHGENLLDPVSAAGLAMIDGGRKGFLVDALADPRFCAAVLHAIRQGRTYPLGEDSELRAVATPRLAEFVGHDDGLDPIISRGEQSNTSVVFGARFLLKVFRRIEEGPHPDYEIGRFLTERQQFEHIAPLLGAVEYRRRADEPTTLAVLHLYVPNQGTAWQLTLDQLSSFFERVLSLPDDQRRHPPGSPPLLGRVGGPDGTLAELADPLLGSVRLMGRRTAEMHLALAADPSDPSFAPEPFTRLYQRSIYQSMRNLTGQVCGELERLMDTVPERTWPAAQALLDRRDELLRRFKGLLDPTVHSTRIRIHGDLHLGELLYTGNNFVMVDFEGDSSRPVGERRIKRSPLRDVARIVRSFHEAAFTTLSGQEGGRGWSPGLVREEDRGLLAPWTRAWHGLVARTFLQDYLATEGIDTLLPATEQGRTVLLDCFLLEKGLLELEYDLDNRRDRIGVPLAGLLDLLGDA